MLDICCLPNDFCIGRYIPQTEWSNENYPDDEYTAFLLDIKYQNQDAIQEAVDLLYRCLSGFDAIAVVPSHRVDGRPSGISQIASKLVHRAKKIDAIPCLKRCKTIQKLSEGGDRSVKRHLESIRPEFTDRISGKRVLLLDDVRTTGHSLTACQQILQAESPTSVHPIALGQTCGPDRCDVGENYHHVEASLCESYYQKMEELKFYETLETDALKHLRTFSGVK